MLTIIRAFLMTLGVIFLLLLLGVAYVWFTNMWQVKTLVHLWQPPAVPVESARSSGVQTEPSDTTTSYATPVESPSSGASDAQVEAMNGAGVDTSFFTSLSDAEVQCFRDRLGTTRVDEIIAGAVPTTAEIVTGLPCIE